MGSPVATGGAGRRWGRVIVGCNLALHHVTIGLPPGAPAPDALVRLIRALSA